MQGCRFFDYSAAAHSRGVASALQRRSVFSLTTFSRRQHFCLILLAFLSLSRTPICLLRDIASLARIDDCRAAPLYLPFSLMPLICHDHFWFRLASLRYILYSLGICCAATKMLIYLMGHFADMMIFS